MKGRFWPEQFSQRSGAVCWPAVGVVIFFYHCPDAFYIGLRLLLLLLLLLLVEDQGDDRQQYA